MLRREVLRKQARNMVYNVHCYMAKEAEEGVRNVKQIQHRTAEATQTCTMTVRRIVKEFNSIDRSKNIKTRCKTRIKKKTVTGFENSVLGTIRRFIHSFHLTYNECPTINNLIPKLQSNFNFKGSPSSVRRIVKGMGFRWKRTEDKKIILLEKSCIRLRRIEYLEQLKRYCQEGRTIVFSDELYLERTQEKNTSYKGPPTVVLHAGYEAGFIPNALHVIQSYDYHSNISDKVYHDWLQHQLIPNLPPRSVLVVDSSAPHNTEYDPAPHSNATKYDMQSWLDEKGIEYSPDMYKPQLYQLIKDNKCHYKKLSLDKMLRDNNHDILRIPTHHPDLNPFEMVWAKIKTHINCNTLSLLENEYIELVKEKVNTIGLQEWKKIFKGVTEIEDCYRDNEFVIDGLSETIVGDLDSSSESEDSESSSSSDEDNNTSANISPKSANIKVECEIKVENVKTD